MGSAAEWFHGASETSSRTQHPWRLPGLTEQRLRLLDSQKIDGLQTIVKKKRRGHAPVSVRRKTPRFHGPRDGESQEVMNSVPIAKVNFDKSRGPSGARAELVCAFGGVRAHHWSCGTKRNSMRGPTVAPQPTDLSPRRTNGGLTEVRSLTIAKGLQQRQTQMDSRELSHGASKNAKRCPR